MTTYGSIPGVKITTSSGTVSGVTIGRDQYLFLVGTGNDEATVDYNEPVRLESRADVDEKFGPESDVANAYRRATANGASPQYIRAVRAEVDEYEETFTDTEGSLADTPVIPDVESITAENGDAELEVSLDYNSPPEIPEGENKIYINPYTGEYESTEADVTITWEVADWETAMVQYKNEVNTGEFAIISPLTASAEVGLDLEGIISEMREDIKLVVGVLGAEYNYTDEDGLPYLSSADYEPDFDNDNIWVIGPTTLEDPDVGSGHGIGALSAVSGLMAGNATTEPIYDSSIRGLAGLSQNITRTDVSALRDAYVCPLRDAGTIRLEDNRSTYDQETNGGWERDFFRKRIVDLTMATMFLIARRQIGGILDSDTVEDVQDAISVELSELVEDRLLEPDAQEVNVYRADDRTIGIDLTITPLGVAKGADIDLQINA